MWNIIESQTVLFNLIYQLVTFENKQCCHNGTVWVFVSKNLKTMVLYNGANHCVTGKISCISLILIMF